MNSLYIMKAFVDNAQPVIQEIKRVHNDHLRLECFTFDPEDLYEDCGCLEYQSEKKHSPEHFEGPINAVYAQFGEETGAALLLEITPEVRGLLSNAVVDILCDRGEQGDIEFINAWEKSANETIYFRMDHMYYMQGGGFELCNEVDQITTDLGAGLEHITWRLGLSYLNDTIDDLIYDATHG